MSEILSSSNPRDAWPVYIYIAGRGHSGSTLLTILLGRHPQIASVGELANLSLQCFRDENTRWTGLCSCGQRPFDCPIWSCALEDVFKTYGADLSNDPFSWRVSDVGLEEEYRANAIWRSPFVWLRHRFWRTLRRIQYSGSPFLRKISGAYRPQKIWAENRSFIAKSIANHCNAQAIVDASKDYLGMRDIYEFSKMPVKILFITRDCRGSVWSTAKYANSSKRRKARIIRGAKEWVAVNARNLRLLQDIPEFDWKQIRYEDLCRNPALILRNIFSFVGLSYSDEILDTSDKLQHTIAGNKIRSASRRLKIQEDIAWQDNLTTEELATIHGICSPLAFRLGYVL